MPGRPAWSFPNLTGEVREGLPRKAREGFPGSPGEGFPGKVLKAERRPFKDLFLWQQMRGKLQMLTIRDSVRVERSAIHRSKAEDKARSAVTKLAMVTVAAPGNIDDKLLRIL